jgi:hypothetical protein
MAGEQSSDTTRFERVTVYVDVVPEAQLLPIITEYATRLAPVCSIITRENFMQPLAHAPTDTCAKDEDVMASSRTAATVGLIRFWQAEEADVFTRDVSDTVSFMNASELLITDKNTADGAVTYAIYRRQMPVLSLARTHLPVLSSLQQLLYTAAAGDTAEEQKEAVKHFLTFPARCGVYTTAHAAAAQGGGSSGREAGTEEVVVVNAEGYPVQLPHAPHCSSPSASLLPPPPTLFANVMSELCSASSKHLDVLRRRNPILPGVLAAFHRYQNRGVLRAMLHRGYRVEVAPGTETAALEWVQKFVALTEAGEVKQTEKVAAAEATLAKFESHWLELPLAQSSP